MFKRTDEPLKYLLNIISNYILNRKSEKIYNVPGSIDLLHAGFARQFAGSKQSHYFYKYLLKLFILLYTLFWHKIFIFFILYFIGFKK